MSPNHLTPTELAREAGLDRRTVIAKCHEMGVPIFQGRIDRTLFFTTLDAEDPGAAAARREGAVARRAAAYFVLFDSSGNMIDSFESAEEAAHAARSIRETDARNDRHFAVIAYDSNGDVIDPRSPAPATFAT